TSAQAEVYYNAPALGWHRMETRARDGEAPFPDVSFADLRVKLRDMTGDGLQDIIRIHDGLVEYWPYRGYGRWGARIVMENSPRFENATFSPGCWLRPQASVAWGRRRGWRGRPDLCGVRTHHDLAQSKRQWLERSDHDIWHSPRDRSNRRSLGGHAGHRHARCAVDVRLRNVRRQHV